MLGLTDIEECSLNFHLADSTIKKPMGRINDVLILANRNYVPIDFITLVGTPTHKSRSPNARVQ